MMHDAQTHMRGMWYTPIPPCSAPPHFTRREFTSTPAQNKNGSREGVYIHATCTTKTAFPRLSTVHEVAITNLIPWRSMQAPNAKSSIVCSRNAATVSLRGNIILSYTTSYFRLCGKMIERPDEEGKKSRFVLARGHVYTYARSKFVCPFVHRRRPMVHAKTRGGVYALPFF